MLRHASTRACPRRVLLASPRPRQLAASLNPSRLLAQHPWSDPALADAVQALDSDTVQVVEPVLTLLHDEGAVDVSVISVGNQCTWGDVLVVATALSERHQRSIAAELVARLKKPLLRQQTRLAETIAAGAEGLGTPWALVDLGDVVVHVFASQDARDAVDLEQVWTSGSSAMRRPDDREGARALVDHASRRKRSRSAPAKLEFVDDHEYGVDDVEVDDDKKLGASDHHHAPQTKSQ